MARFPDTPFQRKLENLNACDEAREWVGTKTLRQAWKTCSKVEWMLWWLFPTFDYEVDALKKLPVRAFTEKKQCGCADPGCRIGWDLTADSLRQYLTATGKRKTKVARKSTED